MGAAGQTAADAFALHGYGHIQAVRTRSAEAPDNEVDHEVSLLGTWTATPRTKAWLQVAYLGETGSVRLDWAFVSFDLSQATTLYLGRARLPLGLANELRDVQALRPSASLPIIYDEERGLADESLRGAVIQHRMRHDTLGAFAAEAFAADAMQGHGGTAAAGQVLGGRLSWEPAGSDWTWKLSGYGGELRAGGGEKERRTALVLSGRLDRGHWAVQAEAGQARLGERKLALAYLQADLALGGAWRGFGRVDQRLSRNPGEATERERSLSLGLAWQASDHWGLRLEWVHHHGGQAHEDDPPRQVPGDTRPTWKQATVALNCQF